MFDTNVTRVERHTVISPVGFGTKNDCAGEDHPQFTLPKRRWSVGSKELRMHVKISFLKPYHIILGIRSGILSKLMWIIS
jgi:hypothetical protein